MYFLINDTQEHVIVKITCSHSRHREKMIYQKSKKETEREEQQTKKNELISRHDWRLKGVYFNHLFLCFFNQVVQKKNMKPTLKLRRSHLCSLRGSIETQTKYLFLLSTI
jgi:SPX domain protein involved in polyphosphate accumulation